MGVEAKSRLEAIITSLGLGFRIEGVQLIDVSPPREVRASFDEVNSAKQERGRRSTWLAATSTRRCPRPRARPRENQHCRRLCHQAPQ